MSPRGNRYRWDGTGRNLDGDVGVPMLGFRRGGFNTVGSDMVSDLGVPSYGEFRHGGPTDGVS